MPTIKLSRPLPLTPWHVLAKIGLAAQREWEPAVLQLVLDEGTTTGARVATHLLGGRQRIAERLLAICVRLGLLQERPGAGFELTESGRSSAETGEILIPEEGTWTLWHCPDRLLPTPVVALETFTEPSTRDDQTRSQRKEAPRKFERLPDDIRALEGRTLGVLHGKYPRVRFEKLRPQGERDAIRDSRLAIALELTPERTLAAVRGKLSGQSIDVGIGEPGLRHDEAWPALLRCAGLLDRWRADDEVLLVAFDETSEPERATFQRDLAIDRPSIGAWGAFDKTVVQGVALMPRTPADAAAWARWRLVHQIQDVATGPRFATWSHEAVRPFGSPPPSLPTRAALAAELRGTSRPAPIYWRLQAAEDWQL